MIRLDDIRTALRPLVGWRPDPSADLPEALTETESGLYFQAAHPLVTLANIRAVMPEDYYLRYPAWDSATTYAAGAKVSHGCGAWIAKQANTGKEPGAKPEWGPYDMLRDYLPELEDDGIAAAVQTFLQGKVLSGETRSLLERRTFFDGAARLQAIVDPRSRLVGMELVPVRAMGVTVKLEKIGLQMRGGTGTVKVYLFHSSQPEPVRTLELEYTNASGAFQWFPLRDVYLPYMGGGTDSGGCWLLCYSQDELPDGMRALNVSRDWSKDPCLTCVGGGLEGWREITKYLQVSPFCAPAWEIAGAAALPDLGDLCYTNTNNYGINCEVSIGCDLTDFIIGQRAMFATVIQKQVAANVLRLLAMNPDVRVNRNQLNVTRDSILYEVDGNPQGRASGLGWELKEAYRALSLDTRGLDRVCLSCDNHGVRYRTV